MIKISPRLEFHEAIERARERAQAQRALLPDDYYGDLPVSLRSHAFTVSGLARLDQINAVADSLAEALAQGDGFDEWKKRALTDPDLAALPRGRLETIYRNAVQTAYHAGRWQQFEQAKRRRPFLMYDAINDQRTRPDHRALDGYIAPVDDPVWYTIAPPNGHNCFLPGTIVQGDFELGLKSFYAGGAVEITTAAGHRLSVTANHPILTRRGWVAAKDIDEADCLLTDGSVINAESSVVVDDQHPPAKVEDLFEALGAQGLGLADMSAFEFHGDAHLREGDVHVVGRDALLVHGVVPAKSLQKRDFKCTGTARVGAQFSPSSPSDANVTGDAEFFDYPAHIAWGASDHGRDRRFSAVAWALIKLKDLFGLCTAFGNASHPRSATLALDGFPGLLDRFPLKLFGFAPAPSVDARGEQVAPDDAAAHAETLCQRVFALPVDVISDDAAYIIILEQSGRFRETAVAAVRRFEYFGHVYDFQTKNSLILANGILSHNCRCSLIGLTQAQAEARGWTGSAQPPSGEPDPGWEHNPARNHIDQLETLLAEREATAAVQPATPALRRGATPDAATLMGMPLLDDIMREARLHDGATIEQALDAGMDAEAADAFRIATVERLRAKRTLGGTPATVQKSGKGRAALLKAAALLPAEWVTYGNAVSIDVEYSEQRAHYQSATTKRKRAAWVTAATIRADDTSSMLHEYMHHLQRMVPGLDDVFQAEHRRRTLGEALVVLYAIRPRETGRRDGYVEPYQGREYDDGGALEVLTMAFETLLGGHLGGRRDRSRLWLANSLRKDRSMLEIALGMLFYYSP